MHATLSFNGLLIGYPSLFDGLQVPSTVSKEEVVNNLLLDTYDLEVMISSGPVMARALEMYSKAMLPSWTRLAKALAVEYNPLNTDDKTRNLSHTGSEDGTRTPDTKTVRTGDLVSEGTNNGSDSTTREVTGYDSAQLQVAEKNTTELGTGNRVHSSGTDTTTNTGSESTTSKKQYTDTESTKGRAGRSAQSLVVEELDLAKQNAVIQIVNDIKQNFCLLVY